jgi:hypothetical protein
VFVSCKGGPLDASGVHRIVKAAAERAGLSAEVSACWLHHAHASDSLDRGAPIHRCSRCPATLISLRPVHQSACADQPTLGLSDPALYSALRARRSAYAHAACPRRPTAQIAYTQAELIGSTLRMESARFSHADKPTRLSWKFPNVFRNFGEVDCRLAYACA